MIGYMANIGLVAGDCTTIMNIVISGTVFVVLLALVLFYIAKRG